MVCVGGVCIYVCMCLHNFAWLCVCMCTCACVVVHVMYTYVCSSTCVVWSTGDNGHGQSSYAVGQQDSRPDVAAMGIPFARR